MQKNKVLYIYILSAITYFLQGISKLPDQALFVYLKNVLHFSPEQIMYLGAVVSFSWVIKPFFGYIIDVMKWKKRTWVMLSICLDLLLAVTLSVKVFPITILTLILFLWNTADATRDVAVDGIMCVEGKKTGTTGKIQAIQWIAITVASIFVGIIGGEIAQRVGYRFGYLLLAIPLTLALIVTSRVEETKTEEKIIWTDFLKLFKNTKFLWVCLFIFLYRYSPSFGTPLSFIMRDSFHWSERFIGWFGAGISCLEILGALLYFKVSQKINIQRWLYYSVFIGAVTTLCYLHYTPATALIYGVIFSVVGMFIHLITMDFMARTSCPGLETTSFALLCAISNLAATASSLSGAWLYPLVGLNPLIVISALASFLCLPLIRRLEIQ